MSLSILPNWLGHPLAEALLRFNLLPSLLLHPARKGTALAPELEALPSLDRHRSAALLKQYRLDPVMGLDDPALPLAMLPDAYFNRLLLLLGAALNAAHVRRTIVREEIDLLKTQLGNEGLAIVRMPTAKALSGLPVAPDWDARRARDICMRWGAAVLAQAFDAASTEVSSRAHLRLAPDADELRAPLVAAALAPERALRIAVELLQSLEPTWLSSFPTNR